LLVLLGSFVTVRGQGPQFTPEQCGAFVLLQFDIFNYDAFTTYFDDSSVLTLAQTGSYKGPSAIEEYLRFADAESAWIGAKERQIVAEELTGFDPFTGTCVFSSYALASVIMEEKLTKGDTFNTGSITKVFYSIPTNNIPVVHIYLPPQSMIGLNEQLDTDEARALVCSILTNPTCEAALGTTSGDLSQTDCETELAKLALTEGDEGYIDSNTQGCRFLHAVLAETNGFHCAHISLDPAEDPLGNIKCQVSEDILPTDLFTDVEIDRISQICAASDLIGNPSCARVIPKKIMIIPSSSSSSSSSSSLKSSKSSKLSKSSKSSKFFKSSKKS